MTKDKITADELKSDQFVDFMAKALKFYAQHKVFVQWSAIGVLAVAVCLAFVSQYKAKIYRSSVKAYETADTLIAMDDFLNKYKGSPLYPVVLFKKGNSLFNDKNYKGAIEAYQPILSNYSNHSIADQALLGTGYCYQAMDDYDNAISAYEKLASNYKNSPFLSVAKINLAKCAAKKGDNKKAMEIVEKMISDEPNSLYSQEAKKLLPGLKRNM